MILVCGVGKYKFFEVGFEGEDEGILAEGESVRVFQMYVILREKMLEQKWKSR